MAEVVSCPPKFHNIKAWTHTQAHTADPLLHFTVFNAPWDVKHIETVTSSVCDPLKEIMSGVGGGVVVVIVDDDDNDDDDDDDDAVVVVHENLTVLSMQINY